MKHLLYLITGAIALPLIIAAGVYCIILFEKYVEPRLDVITYKYDKWFCFIGMVIFSALLLFACYSCGAMIWGDTP